MGRNIQLDSMRGILALVVAVGHYFAFTGFGGYYPSSFVLAVDFFFVLSGFVLTASVMKSRDSFDTWLGKFFTKRARRIFPVYLVCLSGSVMVYFLTKSENTPGPTPYEIANAIFLTQNLGFVDYPLAGFFRGVQLIAWSVSAEFWVGVVFFSLVHHLRDRPAALGLICGLIAWVCISVIISNSPKFMDVHFQKVFGIFTFGMMRALLGFSLGTVTYLLWLRNHQFKAKTIIEILIVGVTIVLFCRRDYDKYSAYLAPLVAFAAVYVFSKEAGWISKALSVAPLAFVGKISYSIYLSHPLVITLLISLNVKPISVANIAIYSSLVIGLSTVLYYSVELRFMSKRRITNKAEVHRTTSNESSLYTSSDIAKAPS